MDRKNCQSTQSIDLKRLSFIISILFLFSCNNELENVIEISSSNSSISAAENINTVYTDSGIVSSILKSPKMFNFTNQVFPYFEFPNKVEIIVFDKNKNRSIITADYAISYSNTDLIDLRKNVVIRTHLEDTLITDQMYYNREEEWLFTNYPFRFISKDRDIYGSGFDADKSFEKITFLDVSGYVTVEE